MLQQTIKNKYDWCIAKAENIKCVSKHVVPVFFIYFFHLNRGLKKISFFFSFLSFFPSHKNYASYINDE